MLRDLTLSRNLLTPAFVLHRVGTVPAVSAAQRKLWLIKPTLDFVAVPGA